MPGRRLRVLLVEDQPGDARLVQYALKSSRPLSFAVIHEMTLGAAFERIAVSAPFDVVLLDLGLPDSVGAETAARFQEVAPDLPVVILTGFDDPDFAEALLDHGAQDYLVKNDITETSVARAIRYAISRKHADLERQIIAERLAASISAENERLEADLSLAREMQFDLLPNRERIDRCRDTHGLVVDSFFEPSYDIGGDLWGCIEAGPGRIALFAFDFSGHGVCAALNVFRLHALLSSLHGRVVDPAATLSQLNQSLCRLLPQGQYATIFLGLIDIDRSLLTWSAGGAPRPILFPPEGEACWLDTRGKPLGISSAARYLNREVAFPPGSTLFVYSDVMSESRWNDRSEIGEEGLLQLVGARRCPEGLDLQGLVADFTAIVGSPMDDDMTAVAVTRLSAHSSTVHRPPASDIPDTAVVAAAPPPGGRLIASTDLSAISQALALPYGGFIEIAQSGLADVGPACYAAAARQGLCLSLNVSSVASRGVVRLLTTALATRFGGERDWEAVEIILGEALANAVVHGSLGVRSGLRESRAGLDQFSRLVQCGLDDPERGNRRIEVTVVPVAQGLLEIAVYDRGQGFDFEAVGPEGPGPGVKHGRGLSLIRKLARSMTFRDEGRTLVVTI